MSRTTHRALTMLALSAALAIGTTAVAGAAEDLNSQRKALYQSQLEQNLAGRTATSAQSAVEQVRAGERNLADQPVAEDQNDRLLRGLETGQAARAQAAIEQARAGERQFAATAAQSAVEQVRAGERNLGPAPVVTIAPRPVPAATGGLDPLAVLLLGLVGGLIAGAAAMAGWTAHRRHAHRVVAARRRPPRHRSPQRPARPPRGRPPSAG